MDNAELSQSYSLPIGPGGAYGPPPYLYRGVEDIFLRDLRHSRELAAHAWLADGSEWVGEWHTHPAGGPQPSARDLHTYAAILAATPSFRVLLSIIVTPHTGSWAEAQLTMWMIGRPNPSGTPPSA
jgi:hypothetical protein